MRELLESSIERLLGDLSTPEYVRSVDNGVWPETLWGALAENGFTLASGSEESGGVGAGWQDLFVVARAAGHHMAPVPLVEMLLANWLLVQTGLKAQDGILTIAPKMSLEYTGDRISGELALVPWGRYSDHVMAILNGVEGARPRVALLETASATAIREGTNIAGEPRDTLVFSSVLPKASASLSDGVSTSVLLCGGAMLRSAQMAGAMTAVMNLSSDYAAERKQFGRPIAKFQAIQQQLAILAEQTAAANVSAEAAFVASDVGLNEFRIAAAKITASDGASEAARIGHSVHGAIGFTQEYQLQLLTRRLWAWRGEFGSTTFWSQLLGGYVCEAGPDRFWPAITQPQQQKLSIPG